MIFMVLRLIFSKNKMKKGLALLLAICLLSFNSGNVKEKMNVVISPESKLFIKGKTNVNSFSCHFNASNFKNPVTLTMEIVDEDLYFEDTNLILNTSCFDCGNKMMNSDFRNLLNADSHPEIKLKLKQLRLKDFDGNDATAFLDIYISGVKNSYSVPISLIGTKKMIIKGKLDLNISDYKLEPPKKMMGLIVVDEMIEINMELIIQEFPI